jgi:hypothetical protein
MIFSRKKDRNKKSIFLDSPKEQNPSHSSSSQLNPLIKEITGHTKYPIHEQNIIKPKTKKYRVRGQAPDNKKTYFSLLISPFAFQRRAHPFLFPLKRRNSFALFEGFVFLLSKL